MAAIRILTSIPIATLIIKPIPMYRWTSEREKAHS